MSLMQVSYVGFTLSLFGLGFSYIVLRIDMPTYRSVNLLLIPISLVVIGLIVVTSHFKIDVSSLF